MRITKNRSDMVQEASKSVKSCSRNLDMVKVRNMRVREAIWKTIAHIKMTSYECMNKSSSFIVSPALEGKTHWITLSTVVCCCCLLWEQVKIWLPHALMDFNQSWVIDATWEPSFVDKVKGHISRSKVMWGQKDRLKMWKWPHLKSWSPIGTKLGLLL